MNAPNPESPTAWLWDEIARRFGQEQADALHHDYNLVTRAYAGKRRGPPLPPGDPRRVKRKARKPGG